MLSSNYKTSRAAPNRRAVIDIGSNTVRLVIFGNPLRAPVTLLNEKITARLGRGVAENGKLSRKSMDLAIEALARFVALLRVYDVQSVRTVATAAVRDAKNGPAFLEAVTALGLSPVLLSGEEEAVTSAMGVVGAFADARGVVADLGGGSLELVHVENQQCEHGISLPLGTLCVARLRATGVAKPAALIAKTIKDTKWKCPPGETLYLVGGSHRAFARFAMDKVRWPIDDPHGFELDPLAAEKICKALLKAKSPLTIRGISASRAASLPDAALLLLELLKAVRPGRLVFSSWGLREGLLYNDLTPLARAQDPLVAAAAEFANRQGSSASSATMVAGWTAGVSSMTGIDRENLRLAATMLALASQAVEANIRAENALQWALRKRWIGIDAEDRAMIAACILANAGRNGAIPAEFASLASQEHLQLAEIWGLAIRLCRRFSGTSPEVLSATALSIDGAELVLSMRGPYATLYTDPAQKDLAALAGKLNLKPVCRRID